MRGLTGLLFVLGGAALIAWATFAASGWIAAGLAVTGAVVVLIGGGFVLAGPRGLVDREGGPPPRTQGRPGPGGVEQQS